MPQAALAFNVAAALLVVLPGPDTLVIIRSMLRGGRRRAVLTAIGGLTGLCVWVATASLGLAAVLWASHDAYYALKIAGAVYLVWLGIQSVRARRSAPPVEERPAAGRSSGFGSGLATNLLNPKVGVFFVAFLPGFVPAGMPVGATSLLLGGIYIVDGRLRRRAGRPVRPRGAVDDHRPSAAPARPAHGGRVHRLRRTPGDRALTCTGGQWAVGDASR